MGNIARLPQNYLSWNERLDVNPPWVPTRMTVPSVAEPSPDGRGTANILHEDASLANTHRLDYNLVLGNNIQYTASFFARSINRDWIRITYIVAGADMFTYYDVANGVVGATNALAAQIEPAGPNWYRCWAVFTGTVMTQFRIFIAEADADVTFDGLDQDSLYVWRPMINEGWGPDPSFLTQEVPRT